MSTQPPRTGFSIAELALDVAALAGAALITYGVSLVYRPAGFMVAGAFLLGAAWIAARKGA